MLRRLATPSVVAALVAVAACATTSSPPAARRLRAGVPLALAGHFSVPALTKFPAAFGSVVIGGLSGLTPTARPGEFLVISDDQNASRMFVVRLAMDATGLQAQVVDAIPVQVSGVPRIDAEGIVRLRDGRIFVSSEGIGSAEPRLPPAIMQFTATGEFVRTLAVRERFVPNPTGPLTRGVRANLGFEALTVAPGGRRMFTASESALAQDGEAVSFERGARARLLEYRAAADGFEPAREFVYPIDAHDPVSFTAAFSVAGLVELLALSETEMLALERTYIEEAGGTGQGVNRARLYRVSLEGATDVSGIATIGDGTEITPVTKTRLLDLGALPGLPPELAELDNFEGLAFGPPLPDGTPTLVMISDDNFNERQRSWFLLLGLR